MNKHLTGLVAVAAVISMGAASVPAEAVTNLEHAKSVITDFINDLKINSANLVDVILDIEEKYDIIIDNEAMERMINVKAAVAIIETKLAEKN